MVLEGTEDEFTFDEPELQYRLRLLARTAGNEMAPLNRILILRRFAR